MVVALATDEEVWRALLANEKLQEYSRRTDIDGKLSNVFYLLNSSTCTGLDVVIIIHICHRHDVQSQLLFYEHAPSKLDLKFLVSFMEWQLIYSTCKVDVFKPSFRLAAKTFQGFTNLQLHCIMSHVKI